jgi:RNA polymerase sigma-70 factor (ECF subfamily)
MSSRRLALILGSFPPALEPSDTLAANLQPAASSPQTTVFTELLYALRSDEDLADALRNGHADALTVLFKRHSRLVFGIARRILRLDAEAEDCVQQIFFDVFRCIGQFDRSKGTFKVWLLLFAYHRTLNRRRSLAAARFFDTEPFEELLTSLLPSHTVADAKLHNSILLQKSLATLQPRQRRTIELTYYEGLTAEEISERTGETVRVVRHNLYRGLEKLRQHLSAPAAAHLTGKGGSR